MWAWEKGKGGGLRKGDKRRKGNFAELLSPARCFRSVISFNLHNKLEKFTDEGN